ncbi:MAG: efflux RND transporter periplasmic adaptor subunit [Amphritea sp.]
MVFWRNLLLGLGGLLLCSVAQAETAKPLVRPAKLYTIENPASRQLRSFPAEVRATSRTELAFRVPGELVELSVQEGQQVTSGQLLARLDPADYQVVLEQRRAQYQLAKAQYDRFHTMLERKLVSAALFDEKKAELDVARAVLNRAKLDMKYTELRAPYDGTVSQRLLENYQNVPAKQTVLVMQSGDQIDIEFQISESIVALKPRPDALNHKVDVSFEALPGQRFKAIFRERTAEADPKTGSYTVTLSMARPDALQLFPGMTATVQVDLRQVFELNEVHYVLPVEAVFSAEDKPADSDVRQVWKVSPDTMQVIRTDVRIGTLTARGIEILSGLQAGDVVVAAGVHYLREAMQVRPWIRERGI